MPENLLESVALLDAFESGLVGSQVSGVWQIPADQKISGQQIDVMRLAIEMSDPAQVQAEDHQYVITAIIRASSNSSTVAEGGGTRLYTLTWYSHPNNQIEEGPPRWRFGTQWGTGDVATRKGHYIGVTLSVTGKIVGSDGTEPLRCRARLDLISGISEE